MASVFTVLTKLQADVSNFTTGMAKAQESIDRLEKAVAKTGGNMDKNLTKQAGKASAGMGKLKGAFGAAAAAGAAFAAINYVQGAVGAASAFEAEFIGVEQTFGSAAQVVKDFAENAAYTAGLSETAALRYAKSFGGFATSAGLAGEAQAKFSTQLVQTAGDLGSFFDLPTEEALAAISQGLRGEYEGLRRFNILLDENALKTIAMNKGIFDGTGELTQQQKVLARQEAILSQVGVAQNDFTNYADTYGNSIKTVSALMQNLNADVGAALLPSMASLAQAFIPIVEQLAPALNKIFEALIPVIESITNALGSVIDVLLPLVDVLVPVIELFAKAIDEVLPPVIDLFAALTPIISDLIGILTPLIDQVLTYLGDIISGHIVPALTAFAGIIETFVVPMIQFLADIIGNYIMPVLNGFGNVFKEVIGPAIDAFTEALRPATTMLDGAFKEAFEAVGEAVSWTWNNILQPVFGGIMDFFRDVLKIDMGVLNKIGDAFAKGFQDSQDNYNEVFNPYANPDYLRVIAEQSAQAGEVIGTAVATGVAKTLNPTTGKGGKATVSAWTKLFLGFTEDVKKQEAKIKLASMGLSNALIEKILGDSDWEKIYDKVLKGGIKTAKNLQNSFNKTTEGIEELTAAFEEFTKKADEFNADIKSMFDGFKILPTVEENLGRFESQIASFADTARDKLMNALSLKLITEEQRQSLNDLVATHESSMRAIAKQRDALDVQLATALGVEEYGKAFRTSIDEMLEGVMPLKYATEIIGEFENAAIASFKAVEDSIKQAVDAGYLTAELSKSMKNLASTTQTQLRGIAKQRDQLAREYQTYVENLNSAKEFRIATRDAAIGYSNITQLGTSARTIIKNFGVMVQRTEVFRDQLSTLNQMGLNKELYNQILNSGLDAGTATAKALLKGGPEAINQMNALYNDLQLTAEVMSQETSAVMFDGGESTIQGFIDGVMAQDEALRMQAEQIATSFTTEFQFSLDSADASIDALISSLKSQQSALEATAVSLAQAFNAAFSAAVSVAIQANAPTTAPKADNTAAIAALDTKIANAMRYIKNINNDKMEAGATAKLAEYVEQRANLVNAATGGYIRGAGTGTSDSIPARLSNGEFVMRASAVDKFGSGFMSAINSGRLPSFATGGMVGRSQITSGGGSRTTVNNTYQINVRTGIGDPAAIGKQVVSAIAAYQKTSGRQIL